MNRNLQGILSHKLNQWFHQYTGKLPGPGIRSEYRRHDERVAHSSGDTEETAKLRKLVTSIHTLLRAPIYEGGDLEDTLHELTTKLAKKRLKGLEFVLWDIGHPFPPVGTTYPLTK